MISDWWDRPVRVRIGDSTTYNVERLDRAAEMLLNEWPEGHAVAFARAQEALLKAMEDRESESARAASRMAFEEAAREAGILVEAPRNSDELPAFTDPANSPKDAPPPPAESLGHVHPPKDTEYAGHPEFSQDAAGNKPPKGIGNSEPLTD